MNLSRSEASYTRHIEGSIRDEDGLQVVEREIAFMEGTKSFSSGRNDDSLKNRHDFGLYSKQSEDTVQEQLYKINKSRSGYLDEKKQEYSTNHSTAL